MGTRQVVNPLEQILGWLSNGVSAVQDFGWSSAEANYPDAEQVDAAKEAALKQLVGNIEETPERVEESIGASAQELERALPASVQELERSVPAAQEQLTNNIEEVIPRELDRSTFAAQNSLSENTGGMVPRAQLPDMPSHDPATMEQAKEEQAKFLARQVTTQAENELKTGDKQADQKWFNMLGAALKQVGKPLAMTFDAWQGLSPSTKVALIGSAGTVWAYNKGWGKTAGDIASGTANLYGNLATNEANIGAKREQALMEATKGANKQNTDQSNEDRNYRLKQLSAAEPSSQQLQEFSKTPAILEAAGLAGGFLGYDSKEENASLLTNVIHSIWRNKAAKGEINPLETGFATFAARQDVIDAALNYVKEQGGINLK